MKKLIFLFFLLIAAFASRAQTDSGQTTVTTDSAVTTTPVVTSKPVKRTVIQKKRVAIDSSRLADSLAKINSFKTSPSLDSAATTSILTIKTQKPAAVAHPIDTFYHKLLSNPFLQTAKKPFYLIINEREKKSSDEVFYLLSGLLLFVAFVKLIFSKYFKNIFRLFFQPSFRQKQTREHLLQNNLPSLLLNLFFIFSVAIYISFMLKYYQVITINFWIILSYSVAFLAILYTGKFVFLHFTGWVFNIKEATATYIFSVGLVNKIMGIVLLPFIILIAFAQPQVVGISVTVSVLLIVLLIIYRYLLSYAPVRKEVQVHFLHILLYIFAFEVTPLLLIYKTLIIFLDKSL